MIFTGIRSMRNAYYSEVLIIRRPMVLVKSSLYSEKVSLDPFTLKITFLVLMQVVLIAMLALILSGLYSGTLLYCNNK